MGIYADYAQTFFDLGLQPVPVEPLTKICRIKNSDKHFFYKKMTQADLDKWIKSHGHWGIGIACGAVSGVVAVDYDLEEYDDGYQYERALCGILEPSPLIKKGKKGWTKFYKYNPKIKNANVKVKGKTLCDILTDGKVTVMPPSSHSDGLDYRWLSVESFEDILPHELPEISLDDIDKITALSKSPLDDFSYPIEDESQDRQNRHLSLFKRTLKLITKHKHTTDVVDDLLKFDMLVHSSDPKGPYFKDPKYCEPGQERPTATKFVDRIIKWKISKHQIDDNFEWSLGQPDLNYWICVDEEKGKFKRSDRKHDFFHFFQRVLGNHKKEFFSETVMQFFDNR